MTNLLGFFSYVHADNDVDHGRIADLAKDIVGHYEALKAEEIRLFLDSDDLHWGDRWRDEIDEALSNVAFFIPVLTPRYFKSTECRREFQFFLERASALGIDQSLILPILYIAVPELTEESPTDGLVQAVKGIQWFPWETLRFAARDSERYRTEVNHLAVELVRRVREIEVTDLVPAAEALESVGDDAPGVLERLAALEEAMPRWSETLQALSAEIAEIGRIVQAGADDMKRGEQQKKGFAARLTVARRVANDLAAPVDTIDGLAREFLTDLNEIDLGFRVVIEMLPAELKESPEHGPAACEFMRQVRTLSESAEGGLGALASMVEASQPLEKMSKDLRAPLRKLRESLRAMYEAREITGAWIGLVDDSGIDCSEGAA